jgi:hypothetical protein
LVTPVVGSSRLGAVHPFVPQLSPDLLAALVAAVAIIFAAVFFGYMVPKFRRRRKLRAPIPIAAFGRPDSALPTRAPRAREPLVEHVVTPQAVRAAPADAMRRASPEAMPRQVANGSEAPPLRLEPNDADPLRRYDEPRHSPPLRVHRSPTHEGTLQFLPGRFEVVEGRDIGQEIRFVRAPGAEATQVTFGRTEGPPYRHVQLFEPTVSRHHARMILDGRSWQLINLSRTNPVVVNGAPMQGEGANVVLADGDRVEMGEVVFRFHSK